MNRSDLQQLADDRVLDAEALLATGRWSAAYYLAGYSVECALKACIAKRTKEFDFPDRDFARDVFTHDLTNLLRHAGLKDRLLSDSAINGAVGPGLSSNWLIVKDWSEQARYRQATEADARRLVLAVTDPAEGVLPWIKLDW